MKYFNSLSILLFLLFATTLGAQITQGAEQAVKKAEDKAISKAIEKTFNGLVNKLFGSDSTSTETTDGTIDSTKTKPTSSGGLFSSKTIEKEFNFDITLDIDITTADKKGKENVVNSLTHYPKDGKYVGIETESVLNIMDFEDMKNYSVVGGKLTVLSLQSIVDKAKKVSKKEQENDEKVPELVKTGKKEIIAGFECEEYTLEDEDMKASYWMTEELGISPATIALAFSTNPNIDVPENSHALVLKMIIYDTKEKTTTTMLTKSINKDKKSYDLSKYKASDLSRLKF